MIYCTKFQSERLFCIPRAVSIDFPDPTTTTDFRGRKFRLGDSVHVKSNPYRCLIRSQQSTAEVHVRILFQAINRMTAATLFPLRVNHSCHVKKKSFYSAAPSIDRDFHENKKSLHFLSTESLTGRSSVSFPLEDAIGAQVTWWTDADFLFAMHATTEKTFER